MFWIYIIYSEKFDKYYVGFSSDIEGRLAAHNHPKTRVILKSTNLGSWFIQSASKINMKLWNMKNISSL